MSLAAEIMALFVKAIDVIALRSKWYVKELHESGPVLPAPRWVNIFNPFYTSDICFIFFYRGFSLITLFQLRRPIINGLENVMFSNYRSVFPGVLLFWQRQKNEWSCQFGLVAGAPGVSKMWLMTKFETQPAKICQSILAEITVDLSLKCSCVQLLMEWVLDWLLWR